jgi:hypothetical protein
MNSLPAINFSSPNTIQLTIPQLTSIFEQLGLNGSTFAPYTQVAIQLESFQLSCNAIAIPITNFNAKPSNVQSIMSSAISGLSIRQTRITREFIKQLAQQLEISEKELIAVIQNSGNINEINKYLNEIFDYNFTQEEIREMIALTLRY